MKLSPPFLASLLAAALGAAPARADELFGGVYAHDLSIVAAGHVARGNVQEPGADLELGWRGGRILPVLGGPQPHVLVSLNSAGATHFAAAGLSWMIGRAIYARPGIGIAIHRGPDHWTRDRIWLGSRLLFEPEIGVGVRLSPRSSIEASWVHLSHAHLFGDQ